MLSPEQIGSNADVLAAYAAARSYPGILDGLYCACRCRDSLHHRSLLSCFETRQPTGCMGCRAEAALAGKLAKDGKTLEGIRQAVDREYGG